MPIFTTDWFILIHFFPDFVTGPLKYLMVLMEELRVQDKPTGQGTGPYLIPLSLFYCYFFICV